MRRKVETAEAPGQDSFLDVVANLVGILIIFVMIVGSQAKSAAVVQAQQTVQAVDLSAEEKAAENAKISAEEVARNMQELERKIAREKLEAALREEERAKYQIVVTVAEQRLTQHRDQLSDAERAKYDLQQQLLLARRELEEVTRAGALGNEKTPAAVLEHIPTPMAKTVFGKEVHFRLLKGRLCYLPWDEMVERLKADAPSKAQKLRDTNRIEESLPPINNFAAKYSLRRTEASVQTRAGAASQSRVELERFYFVALAEDLGEPVAQALAQGSEFRSRLREMNPRQTTVTVWVYPESFDQFRAVKAELFKLGFLSAARPMPDGFPIGGSPDGTRSSAE
jgi:hypothetical protein